uniref:Uncharacterized protein n=1 Tax=Paramormyrops kingsleyae TaxID=1676925 RepID=A0A3B3RJN2_9TELE
MRQSSSLNNAACRLCPAGRSPSLGVRAADPRQSGGYRQVPQHAVPMDINLHAAVLQIFYRPNIISEHWGSGLAAHSKLDDPQWGSYTLMSLFPALPSIPALPSPSYILFI